ncbi:hypothetical protein V2J09_023027 [Rumex salicifolius]
MGDEKDAFYVVRKGDVVGIYRNFTDCQAQLGPSMMSPSVTVYKGFGLGKDVEEFLASRGLQNSSFSVSASDVKDGMFGNLMVCPIQQPSVDQVKAYENSLRFPQKKNQDSLDVERAKANALSSFLPTPSPKRSRVEVVSGCYGVLPTSSTSNAAGSPSLLMNSSIKQDKLDNVKDSRTMSSSCKSCVLEFDGASKGNPGLSGAGAVLRADDGTVFQLREGVGIATNNVAEYRAVILGLKYALSKGFKQIRVRGDSKLVCMQVQGLWQCKNANMAKLCKEVNDLKNKFSSFQIEHILREFNSEADAQANRAVSLKDAEVQVDCTKK